MSSRELLFGYRLGKGSVYETKQIVEQSLGEKSTILIALEQLHPSTRMELEIVSAISHLLKKPVEYSAPLKVALANDYVNSRHKLVVSDYELMNVLPQSGNSMGPQPLSTKDNERVEKQ